MMLTLGLWRLLRSIKLTRRMLREIPTPDKLRPMVQAERTGLLYLTYKLPKEMTGLQVPLTMKPGTAMEMRRILEDWVLMQERLASRMETLAGICSEALKRSSKSIDMDSSRKSVIEQLSK